jgi:hypothetical protein
MTRDQAIALPTGTVLHHKELRNADKTPLRARVNGRPKLWVTRPEQFRLPMKHGMKHCFYITERDAHLWELA